MAATKDILEPSLEMLGISPYKQKKTEEYMSAKMREHFTTILTLFAQADYGRSRSYCASYER